MDGRKYPRWQARRIKEALGIRRVVVVSGARQTGKTTLCRQVAAPADVFRTLDDTVLLDAAIADPRGFVKNPTGTLIIDEIQKAPKLVTEIKQAVDKNDRPGQYLLTGSANIWTIPTVGESLAGRVRNIRLRPLTVGEMLEKPPQFLRYAFTGEFPASIPGVDKEKLVELAFRGGYPEPARLADDRDRREWHRDYTDSLLARDLRDIANIRRQDILRELVGTLAAWSGKFIDIAGICSVLGLAKVTLESYINAMMSLYLFEKVQPWIRSDYDRIGRRAKIYATDTGWMATMLGWNQADVVLDADRSGKLLETFVFHELAAQIDLDSGYILSQYRDRENREIDFVIEREDGALAGIEVKAGHNVGMGDFRHLIWFRDHLATGRHFTGIVLYSGEHTLSFGEGLWAVPTAALWA